MNSWDCFDTLIFRKLYHPHSVFAAVGEKLGIDNFVEMRVAAEARSDNTYLGIYKHLSNIDPEIEIQTELDHCFPIVENINKVEDGDVIISDMYHTPEFVEKLLRKCGLTKDVKFIVTPNGKSGGHIWKSIKNIDTHTGDNIHSDVHMPSRNGITANHYTECFFTKNEEQVGSHDYLLACWMRYIRLSFPYLTQHEKNLWVDQSQYNLPSLLLGSLELPSDKNIAFNFRDCVYWKPMYENLIGKTSKEFHSSRKCYKKSSDTYKNYAYNQTQDCIIVDLQGTGSSVETFFAKSRDILYLAGSSRNSITQIIDDAIERHNCCELGTLIDWDENGPVRKACEHNEIVIKVQSEASSIAINSIHTFGKYKKNLELLKILVSKMTNNYTDNNVSHIMYH